MSSRQDSRDKARLVEDIAAAMYRMPGFDVETRVPLTPLGGASKRSELREIDVLIKLMTPGLPVPLRMAIECKDERGPIGVERIDAFASKLDDVGIPRSLGLFVSTSRYTSGALRRAQKERIKTLVLVSDPLEQIPEEIKRLVQPVVLVLLRVDKIYLEAGIAMDRQNSDMLRMADGSHAGSVRDLLWAEWLRGKPGLTLGKHTLHRIPTRGRGHIVGGLFVPISSLSADVHLQGLMLEVPGTPEQHRLIEAPTKKTARGRVHVKFVMKPAVYSVESADTEAELTALVKKRNPMNLPVVRVGVPRIAYGGLYWPPSELAAWKLAIIARAQKAGRISDPLPLITQVERPDVSAAFEPIWSEYPALDLAQLDQPSEDASEADSE